MFDILRAINVPKVSMYFRLPQRYSWKACSVPLNHIRSNRLSGELMSGECWWASMEASPPSPNPHPSAVLSSKLPMKSPHARTAGTVGRVKLVSLTPFLFLKCSLIPSTAHTSRDSWGTLPWSLEWEALGWRLQMTGATLSHCPTCDLHHRKTLLATKWSPKARPSPHGPSPKPVTNGIFHVSQI